MLNFKSDVWNTILLYTSNIFYFFVSQTKHWPNFTNVYSPHPTIIFKGQVPYAYFVDYAWPPPEERRWIYSMTSWVIFEISIKILTEVGWKLISKKNSMYSPAPSPQTFDNCLGLQMVIPTVVNTCPALLDVVRRVSGERMLVNDRKVELLAPQLQPVDASLGNCQLGLWKQPEVLPHPCSLSKLPGVLQKQFLHVTCNRGQVSICLMQIMLAFETLNLFWENKFGL